VTIQNFSFSPADTTFSVGQTVTVTNEDSVAHTWTSTEGGWDTGPIQQGQSKTVTLSKAGTFKVFCKPHPFMTGTITVK
jgi:plastocyanin